ncbi:LCP family protein [Nakamurella lactea]|uniref:LCP family protein n=1 Tax=Nakamurella lactea TaxID=459515 RepID=UPI000403FC53|nr:LCP family protein [Nakamurella lactea]
MSEPPRDRSDGDAGRGEHPRGGAAGDDAAGSAPWERPRRWNQQRLNATRVDELLARLGNEEETGGRRRRRREAEERAALAGTGDDAGDETAGDGTAGDETAGDGTAGDGTAGDETAGDETAGDETAGDETAGDGTAADGTGESPAGDSAGAAPDEPGRRSERADQISAADLIAAFGGTVPGRQTPPDAPTPTPAPEIPGASETTDIIDPQAAAALRSQADAAPAEPHPPAADVRPRFGGPGVVSMPGHDDDGTDQMPLIGPQEDISSIRESLRRQHLTAPVAGAVAASAAREDRPAASPAGTGVGGQATTGQATTGHAATGHAATGPRRSRTSTHGFLWAGRAAIAAVSALILVFTGIYWNLTKTADADIAGNSGNGSYVQPTDTHISTPSTKSKDPTAAAAPVTLYEPENILLLGSDTRAGANANSGNSDGTQNTAQSDTIMIAHLSADRQNVTVLSIPRDLHVTAPHCKIWNSETGKLSDEEQPVNDTTQWKITNAYSVGGPACSVKAVQQLTGLRIDRVIGIDFDGFKSMVDALGGVTVNVCKPIVDAELQTVVPTAGVQTIRGDQALNLVRARKVIGDSTGDYGRIRRQQVVLSAMLRQLTSAGTLLRPGKLNDFLKAFTSATFTDNVTFDSLLDLAHSLGDLAPGKVTFFTVPARPNPVDDGDSQVLVKDKAEPMFAALVNDERLPGETVSSSSAATKGSTATKSGTASKSASASSRSTSSEATTSTSAAPQTLSVDPGSIKLQIVNMTGVAGKSTEAMDILNGYGFAVTPDDLYRPEDQTQNGLTVEYTAGNRDAAVVVAAAVPGSQLVAVDDTGSYQVRLVLGTSYDGNLSSVAVGQTVPTRLQSTPATSPSSSSATSNSTPTPTTDTGGSAAGAGVNAGGAGAATPKTTAASPLDSTDLNAVNAEQTGCV